MRNLTTDFITAAQAEVLRVGLICEIDYVGAPLRAWTGPTNLTWDGKTWLGVGDLGGISGVQEKNTPEAPALTLTISGIQSANLALALDNSSQRRRATLWLALFEESGGTWSVIDDPWRVRRGWTDMHRILIGGKTATIEVTIESLLARLKAARTARYTDHDQQRLFPGDTGFRYSATIGERPIYWGVPAPSGVAAASPIGGGGTVGEAE